MDGYIFKYYGDLLNNKYNEICANKGIDNVSLAYRNNKEGQNNIHFAAEVIQFITDQQQAFIFVSDFKSYFDNLDHAILKGKLISALGKSQMLSNDWWNVFKHITKYSWVEKSDIARDLERTKGKKIGDNTSGERFFTPAEFREVSKSCPH